MMLNSYGVAMLSIDWQLSLLNY